VRSVRDCWGDCMEYDENGDVIGDEDENEGKEMDGDE
jgi:hypothetical protein